MIKVAFVCHGNICRSPLAEFLMKDKLKKLNLLDKFEVQSFGTSYEEHGNPVYPPVKRLLNKINIDCSAKRAQTITARDYPKFDYFLCMDSYNKRNLLKIFGSDTENKVFMLLDFVKGIEDNEVADPYYYGGYDKVFSDINKGIDGFITHLNIK